MQRYWGRIAFGALAIFFVGMIAITLARHGIAKFDALTKSDRPIGIPLALLPFRLEGDELGTVRRLELLRSSPKTVTGVRLTVKLQDSSDVTNLEGCTVTVREPAFGGRDGFVCSSAADSAAEHLQQIGELVVEPGGLVRAILAPAGPGADASTPLPSPAAVGCDPAYPSVCIPPPPPDLDCADVTFRRFTVLAPDPHRFDGDGDGIGCEG